MTQFCNWWVDSPHYFGDLVVLWGRRVFPWCLEAEGALSGDDGRCTYNGCDGKANSWEHHKQHNYTTDWWILTIFSFQLVPRVVRLSPPFTEAEGALGAMMGAHPILMGDGRTCWWWDAAILWPLEESHRFYGGGVGWVRTGFGRVCCRELASGRWLEYKKGARLQKFHCSWWQMWWRFFSCADCLPLIVIWSLDLLASFHQWFK